LRRENIAPSRVEYGEGYLEGSWSRFEGLCPRP